MDNGLLLYNTRAGLIPALIFLSISIFPPNIFAQERPNIKLTENDRILIVAPHPDDEMLATAGVIQEALRLGVPLKIVYLTNGDSNALAFLFYKKRLLLARNTAIAFGEERIKEAEGAGSFLGVKPENRIFLGYPDYGLLKMFTHYWRSQSFKGILTSARQIPYAQSTSHGKAHTAHNLLEDLMKIIEEYNPTKIFVSHPADLSPDHQAAYLFVTVALWELKETPDVFVYLTHEHKWPWPQRFSPDKMMLPPVNLAQEPWTNFLLSPEQISGKEKALEHFQTQIPYRRYYLKSFIRPNELFSTVSDSSLIVTNGQVHLDYPVPSGIPDEFPLEIYVLGYKTQKAFGQMPKIVIKLFSDGQVVYDGYTPLRGKQIKVTQENRRISLQCPLDVLGDPEKILTSIKSTYNPWPSDIGQWRILKLSQSHESHRP